MNSFFLRVPLQDQIIFSRHLAIMTKAGMSLVDSLTMLRNQASSKSMKTILTKVIAEVSNGQFLSSSFEPFRGVFGDLFINVIKVGEASGILTENLTYLSTYLKKKQELKRKITGALLYPIIIIIATLGVTTMLTVFIIPKILPIFRSLNITLPLTTKILIAISDLLLTKGHLVVLGIIVLIISSWLLLKVRKVRFYYDRILIDLPFVGKMVLDVNMVNFCRTLGLLLKSDVKIVEAITITSKSMTNLVYKKELEIMAEELTKGEEINRHLKTRPDLFPQILSQMVEVGETTGNLSETFIYLSEVYEEDLTDMTDNLTSVLEPALMLTMGLMVGFVAISIITPIYEVSQTLGK